MKLKIILLIFLTTLSVSAQTWTNIGNAAFTAIEANHSSFVLDSNDVPYVVYTDSDNSYKATARKFNGTSWVIVGTPGFSTNESSNFSLVIDSNDFLYVAYKDYTDGAVVKKFDGTSWVTLGTTGFASTNVLNLTLDSNNIPYVAYYDTTSSAKVSVKKFDINNNSWGYVGSAGFSAGAGYYADLKVDSNDVLYVAYSDVGLGDKTTVMKFDTATSSWINVGTAGFTAGTSRDESLALDSNNIPYVAFRDGANGNKTSVVKFDTATSSWVTVGTAGFSAGVSDSQYLTLDSNDIPYVAYSDGVNTGKTTVMKFNGTAWNNVGSAGFSSGRGQDQNLMLDSNDIPYISYADDSDQQSITVKKFYTAVQRTLTISPLVNGTVTTDIAPTNGTYDNGVVIELTATPVAGYQFEGWTGDVNGSTNPLSITMSTDKTVTATFIKLTTWTGNFSADWHVAGNWTNGTPSITTNAIIPTNNNNSPNPIVSTGTAIVKDLEIQSSRPFSINAGAALTIEGNLTQSGTIIVNTSATLNGSLILKGTTSGFVTYNRHTKTSNWHLMSSPVLSESISRFSGNGGYSTNGNNHAIATYDNTIALLSPHYVYYTTPAGGNNIANAGQFVAGKGYSIKTDFASIFPFTGYINASDVSVAITDGSATGNKWNLVGNPFTASINGNANADAVNNFLTVNANQLDPSRVAMYVWNGTSYDIINQATVGSKYIAVTQGFFVESKDTGGTLQFTEAMQSHETGDNFQRTSNTVPSIELIVSNGTSQKSTDIKYFPTATIGLDPGYDAGLFSGESQGFSVFTQLVSNDSTVNFGIQSLPTSNYETMVIPVGIVAKAGKEITFSISTANLPNDSAIYLEDKVNGTFVSLSEKTYKTTLDNDANGTGQFFIHTSSKSLSTEALSIVENVSVYKSSNQQITITGIEDEATVKVYSLLGKEVFASKIVAKGKSIVSLPNLNTGVYIVNLNTATGEVTKKIILE